MRFGLRVGCHFGTSHESNEGTTSYATVPSPFDSILTRLDPEGLLPMECS